MCSVGVEWKEEVVKRKLGEYGEMEKGWRGEDGKGFMKVSCRGLGVYYNKEKEEEI